MHGDIYVGSLISDSSYLVHHGVLGMKWGIRRYQNKDGTLTAQGKSRYGTTSALRRTLRGMANTTLGQKLAVRMNKGYREDRKEIKSAYLEKKSKLNKNSSKYKENLKSLNDDYKKTKGEAATAAADAIYGRQSHELNKKIQTESIGKSVAKSILMGGYGSLKHSQARTSDMDRTTSAAIGIVTGFADRALYNIPSVVDSFSFSQNYVTKQDKEQVSSYRKSQRQKRKR